MNKRNIVLNAAIATLVAAGIAAKSSPVMADESDSPSATQEGKKDSCNGKDGCNEKANTKSKKSDKDSCQGKDGCMSTDSSKDKEGSGD